MNDKAKKILMNIVPKVLFILAVGILWQLAYDNKWLSPVGFPSLGQIFSALFTEWADGEMLAVTLNSLASIGMGLLWGVVLSFVLSMLAIMFKSFYSIYSMVVAVFDLLPGIALMPIVMILCGLENTMLVIMIHSIIWPVSRNIIDGYHSTPKIYVEMGQNIGLNKFSIIPGIYFPASLPSIISGLKTGWARAWRAFISVEAVLCATASNGAGIGSYIMTAKTTLSYDKVYAALIVIMAIGIVIEYLIFANIEKYTIRKWGMVR